MIDLEILGSPTYSPVLESILKNTEYANLSTFGLREQSFSHNKDGSIGKTLCTKYVEVHLF
jgi:hypothetical protein